MRERCAHRADASGGRCALGCRQKGLIDVRIANRYIEADEIAADTSTLKCGFSRRTSAWISGLSTCGSVEGTSRPRRVGRGMRVRAQVRSKTRLFHYQ